MIEIDIANLILLIFWIIFCPVPCLVVDYLIDTPKFEGKYKDLRWAVHTFVWATAYMMVAVLVLRLSKDI